MPKQHINKPFFKFYTLGAKKNVKNADIALAINSKERIMQTILNQSAPIVINTRSQKHTLSSYYGYSFEYDKTNLNTSDIDEVETGLLRVAARVDEFLKLAHINSNENAIKELALSIKSILPTSKYAEHQNMIFSKVLELFDRLIAQNSIKLPALKQANILFRKFINLQNRFVFCA